MNIIRTAAIAIALLPATAHAMDPGEWQITTTMSSPMFPKPQTMAQTQCIRKGDSDDPNRLMGEQPSGCKVTVKQKSANGYAWDMSARRKASAAAAA